MSVVAENLLHGFGFTKVNSPGDKPLHPGTFATDIFPALSFIISAP